MLSLKENIRGVLEVHFSQCKDELIDNATNCIYALFITKINKIKNVIKEVGEDENH